MGTKILSDYSPASLSGITDDQGNSIVNPSTEGGAAGVFGDTALREIRTGLANGFFSLPPADGTANISADNPLPYFDYAASGTGVTARIVSYPGGASGNALRFTIAANTTGTASVSAFIDADSAAGYGQAFTFPVTYGSATNSTTASLKIDVTYYQQDQTTTTGTATQINQTFNAIGTASGFQVANGGVGERTPDATAWAKVTVTIAATATAGTARSIDIRSITRDHFKASRTYFPDESDATQPSGYIYQGGGDMWIQSGGSDITVWGNTRSQEWTTSHELRRSQIQAGSVDLLAPETDNHINGIELRRTTDLSIGTADLTGATAITWSTAVKKPVDTGLSVGTAYWTSGTTVTVPYEGWYSIHAQLRFGSGTGYNFRMFIYSGSTLLVETNKEASTTSARDLCEATTLAFLAAGATVLVRASTTAAGKSIQVTNSVNELQIIYLGGMT